MGGSYTVDTKVLEDIANQIESKNNSYDAEWPKLYEEISQLRVEFEGQTSQTFNEKIEGYRDDLQNMGNVVRKYISYLRKSAQRHADVENRLTQEAGNLYTGN